MKLEQNIKKKKVLFFYKIFTNLFYVIVTIQLKQKQKNEYIYTYIHLHTVNVSVVK
jgi:hypothetical protein